MPVFAKITFTFLLALLASNAQADNALEFNIPAQNLPAALKQLAGQSRLQMLYDGPTVQGKHSAALKGRYTPQQALQKVLAGTGLRSVATGNNAVAVKPAPETKPKATEPSSETTLEKVTVEADASYDPDWAKDPYNPDYVLLNATNGTKTDTPIMETPLNVQVISKQVLKDQQVINLSQALQNVSGVNTTKNAGAFGQGEQVFLRGFPTNTIFRNGFRNDGGALGFGQQFANVESVEVLKGPAAILYGRVEPGGAVNIVTKQPRATPYYALNQ
jgi:iron complex outermembrane recepter protein